MFMFLIFFMTVSPGIEEFLDPEFTEFFEWKEPEKSELQNQFWDSDFEEYDVLLDQRWKNWADSVERFYSFWKH